MKKLLAIVACCGLVMFTTTNAWAFPEFKNAFQKKYVDPSGNAEFETAFKRAGCNACHVKGKAKDMQNDYGKELSALIPGSGAERLKEAKAAGNDAEVKAELLKELEAAFPKVEAMKSPSGKTWGEMFKAGELPAAE